MQEALKLRVMPTLIMLVHLLTIHTVNLALDKACTKVSAVAYAQGSGNAMARLGSVEDARLVRAVSSGARTHTLTFL